MCVRARDARTNANPKSAAYTRERAHESRGVGFGLDDRFVLFGLDDYFLSDFLAGFLDAVGLGEARHELPEEVQHRAHQASIRLRSVVGVACCGDPENRQGHACSHVHLCVAFVNAGKGNDGLGNRGKTEGRSARQRQPPPSKRGPT